MTNERKESDQEERYTHGHSSSVVQFYSSRTADLEGAFFTPHLRSGMRLLDCGCGGGSITLGLAKVVSPGEVVGIDIGEASLEHAKALAVEEGVSNIRFEIGSVYELPFPDESFDAVFSHMVLEHLNEPQRALLEMRRVLKPGGFVGIRDVDHGSQIIGPSPYSALVEDLLEIYRRLWQRNGGDPYIGRRLKPMLRGVGFAVVQASASTWVLPTPEIIRPWVDAAIQRFREPDFAEEVVRLGWTDHAALKKMLAAIDSFGDDPDVFMAEMQCEAVAWKG